jgi:hypothetical protein
MGYVLIGIVLVAGAFGLGYLVGTRRTLAWCQRVLDGTAS